MGTAFDLVATLVMRRYGVPELAARDATIAVTHLITRFITNSPEDNRRAFMVQTDDEARARIVVILLKTAHVLLGVP